MKIENKIIFSNIFYVGLMVLIGIFAFQALNSMLAKLRFMEIADDLNTSFLEMRLSEKNYFLYKDQSALSDIGDKIANAKATVASSSTDIARAVGVQKLQRMNEYLDSYSAAVKEAAGSKALDQRTENRIRAEGKRLREFSYELTKLERQRVNEIITKSKDLMLISFFWIILSAILVSRFVSKKILMSLRRIEGLAKSIGEGNYEKIEGINSKDEVGSVILAINAMSDELKNREEEITQSKKLASLGVLTAGVAHEITNPVNNISMIAQTYEELYDSLSREQRLDLMEKVDLETYRIKEIVRNLLDFSKPKKADLHPEDINRVVRKSLKLVQNVLDINKIEVHLNLRKNLPPVLLDEHQIQQVLVNLIVNATQAMPDGGWLNIVTGQDKEKRVVTTCIADSGKGIPAEHLPHVFDPFFSTKGVGGTGLGLSVSYGIIKDHKGRIKVESTEGVGSVFTIELPFMNNQEEKNG